ncbi:hypothetical protein, partial [Lentimicrobium sp.]
MYNRTLHHPAAKATVAASPREIKAIIMPSAYLIALFFLFFSIFALPEGFSQKKNKTPEQDTLKSGSFSGLKFRSIGPAFSSGRIADFAVNPGNIAEYYVAVASGHIWKTVNAGTTWEPVFDNYG